MGKLGRIVLLGVLATLIAVPMVGCGKEEEPAGVGALDQKDAPAKNSKLDPMKAKGGSEGVE